MKIVNLTPHPLEFRSTPDCLPLRIESSGIARCEATETAVGGIHGMFPSADGVNPDDTVIPIVTTKFGAVDGLPAPVEGTIYVVSSITAQSCPERSDVFVPAQPIRDAQGRIVACAALGRVTTSRAMRCEAAVKRVLQLDANPTGAADRARYIDGGDSWGVGTDLLVAWEGGA
jgi:hypothetical protein